MKFYKSRLFWVGIVTAVYGLLKFSGVLLWLGVDVELSPGLLEGILGVIVVILRFLTKEEIVLVDKK
jgi:uncharacterized membrane protein